MDWQTVGILALVFAALFVLGRFMPRGGGCWGIGQAVRWAEKIDADNQKAKENPEKEHK